MHNNELHLELVLYMTSDQERYNRVTACTKCRYEVSILQLLHIVLLGVLNFKQVANRDLAWQWWNAVLQA